MGRPSSLVPAGPAPLATEIGRLGDARDANAQEHDLTFLQALRLYPKGVFWSIIMSTAVIMEGYDTKLISTLFAQPAFQKAYGKLVKADSYQISAPWQAGLSNGAAVGQLVGLLVAGYVSERFGFRKTIMAGMTMTIALIFITFFSSSLVVLEVGQALFGGYFHPSLTAACFLRHSVGVPLGLFQTTPVIYALEISPLCLRAYLTNYVNFCWV
jgi:SP family general alpha glucoside:H+ symporter-like MFS transporter